VNHISQEILSLVLIYRYPALFFISFVSSLGVPLPAAATAAAAAAFASQGYLNLFLLLLSGVSGNIIGDVTMYWLMRKFGKRLLYFIRLRKFADSAILNNVEQTVETYNAPVIIASRFQDQATTLVNIISGLAKLDFRRFLLLTSIGDILQIIFYVGLGSVFADNWQAIYGLIGKFGWIIALIIIIAVALISTRTIRKSFKRRQKS